VIKASGDTKLKKMEGKMEKSKVPLVIVPKTVNQENVVMPSLLKAAGLSKPTAKHPAKLKSAGDIDHPASLSAAKGGRMKTMKQAKAATDAMLGEHGIAQSKDPGVPRKKGRLANKPPYETPTGGVSGMDSCAAENLGAAPNVPKPMSVKSASDIRQEKVGTPRIKTKAPSHKKPYSVKA
jgi:hypothetical protein